MKLREFLKELISNVKTSISRFLAAFVCTILAYFTIAFEIIFETGRDELIVSMCMAFGIIAVLSVLIKLTEEYYVPKLTGLIQHIICFIALVGAFLLIYNNYQSLYTIMAYSGILIALICFIFFIIMSGENKDLSFPKLVASLVFSWAVCATVSAGLGICIAAFQTLIFSYDDFYKVYQTTLLFVWIVGYINIFLTFIPRKDVASSSSKMFRIFVLFAGLPLYILLITILLLYLAKIIITQNMPVGEINWFASFASLFFIFFLLSVKQYSEKLARFFVKFGGYFLIPVLIMQAIAVFERINAYGLTTPRTVSLVLIFISILFIGISIISSKHINKIVFASGIIVLLVTVTPFNVIDMPIASQTGILESVLIKNDMLKDGVVIPDPDIDKKDAEKILSAYNYLKYNAKKVPEFIKDSKKETKEIFGFAEFYMDTRDAIYCSYKTKNPADIADYDKMFILEENDNMTEFEYNDQKYIIDIKKLAKELYDNYGPEAEEIEIYKYNENISLYFSNFNMDIVEDEVDYCYANGYILFNE